MSMVTFKKGLRAGLPATYAEGTFYVTTDERAIYLDISDSARIRLGDFQEFATIDALIANTNPNTTALYYVSDINCLAKWNGSEYIQINRDTGMTSVEVVGEGNAVTAAVYSADGRKLTLTKGATYMTAADVDGKISTAVGTLGNDGEGNPYANVKAYVDAKTAGIASDAALTALAGRVDTAESEIDALQAAIAEGGATATAIATAQAAAEAAQADVDALEGVVGTVEEGKTVVGLIKTAQDQADKGVADAATAQAAADAAQADVDAVEELIGDVTEGKTVVEMIADAQAAATYDDTELDGRVAAIEADYLKAADKTELEGKITAVQTAVDTEKSRAEGIEAGLRSDINTVKADYLKAADKTELSNAISAETNRATGIEAGLESRLAAVEGDYLKAADKTELQENIDTVAGAVERLTNGVSAEEIDGVNDLIQYVKDHGPEVTGMQEDIADNTAAIEAVAGRMDTAESDIDALEVALEDAVAVMDTIKPDWNENNPESKAYINNRPFYDDIGLTPLAVTHGYESVYDFAAVENLALTFEDGDCKLKSCIIDIWEGDKFKVVWDGVEYECERGTDPEEGFAALGSTADGHPFCFVDWDGAWRGVRIFAYNANGEKEVGITTHTISVYAESETVVKIPEKYLPDTVATVAYVDEQVEILNGNDDKLSERIDALESSVGKSGSIADDIAAAKDEAIEAAAADATSKANAAEAAAKGHADSLNTEMNTRVEALEAIDHDHANKDELDKIADGDVAKWNAAQANAEATAAAALASAKSELEGKITAEATTARAAEKANADAIAVLNGSETTDGSVAKALADAKAYADQAETDAVATANAYTDAALTWGSF